MIRGAHPEDLAMLPRTETEVKIAGWAAAYGWERPFLHIWTTERGSQIACMGRDALAAVEREDVDEAALFLSMQPLVQTVRADPELIQQLSQIRPGRVEQGAVMRLKHPALEPGEMAQPPLPDVYRLLGEVFAGALPPWEDWYVDVSHRLRHGYCRIMGVMEENKLAAVAMTTAECDTAAVIGGVATRPASRGRGYARHCVMNVAAALQKDGKAVWLSPKNEMAHTLYTRWGFEDAGEWAAITWEDVSG